MRFSFSVAAPAAALLLVVQQSFVPSAHGFASSGPQQSSGGGSITKQHLLHVATTSIIVASTPTTTNSAAMSSDAAKVDTMVVESPPPLSKLERLQRAASFWSTAIPIVANYYGLIGRIKLQERLGESHGEEAIEVRNTPDRDAIVGGCFNSYQVSHVLLWLWLRLCCLIG